MKFVEEIVVDTFLPTIRSLLAEALSERGLTQREVAEAVGVSQSAVSKYVHGEVERHPSIAGDQRVCQRVEDLADDLSAGTISSVGALVELEVLIRELEAPGDILARLHEEAVPELAEFHVDFRVHDPDSRVRRRERIRASVRRAVGQIEHTPAFVQVIPQVGSNVVEILPEGETVDDVVGIPGRIIDVEGRVLIPGDPEFGVSGHLAGVLLAARRSGSEARAAINLRFEPWIIDSLREAGHDVVEIKGDEDVPAAVETHLGDRRAASVIAQTGGFGIEPATYVLAAEAPSAVDIALSVLDR